MILVIDYRCFVWANEVLVDDVAFRDTALDTLELLNKVADSRKKIIVNNSLDDFISTGFNVPSGDEFIEHYPQYSDVSTAYLNVLTKLNIEVVDCEGNSDLVSAPSLKSPNYHHVFYDCIDELHLHLVENSNNFFILSINKYMPVAEVGSISIKKDEASATGIYSTTGSGTDLLIDGCDRVFEPNPKHDPVQHHKSNKGNRVSILHTTLEKSQRLLCTAVSDGQSGRLYNIDNDIGKYIIFHRHAENTYHGYNLDQIEQRIADKFN